MLKFGIIGAGLLGRLAAFFLNKSGYEVDVFEKSSVNPLLGESRSAAYTSAGMLSPLSEKESGGKIVYDLGKSSMKIWPLIDLSIKKILGHGVGLKISGNLFICSPNEISYASRLLNKIDFNQNPINSEKIKFLEPNLSEKFKVWFVNNEGHINPSLAMNSLYEATLLGSHKKKIKWRFNYPIINFGPGWVKGVNEKFSYDWVFDFRGANAKEKEIRGVRGENFIIQSLNGFVLKHPIRFIHPRLKVYLVPLSFDKIIVGSTEIESEDLSPVSVQSTLDLLGVAKYIFPELSEARIVSSDVNLRPATKDNLPFSKFEQGLVIGNGLFRHGWLVAPAFLINLFNQLKLNLPFD
jgi:glycine oxidase